MISDEKYVHVLDKLIPVEDGRARYDAVKKIGFVDSKSDYGVKTPEIETAIFRIQYLEFIRYNIDRIEFELL